jgi:hypothetical protein
MGLGLEDSGSGPSIAPVRAAYRKDFLDSLPEKKRGKFGDISDGQLQQFFVNELTWLNSKGEAKEAASKNRGDNPWEKWLREYYGFDIVEHSPEEYKAPVYHKPEKGKPMEVWLKDSLSANNISSEANNLGNLMNGQAWGSGGTSSTTAVSKDGITIGGRKIV